MRHHALFTLVLLLASTAAVDAGTGELTIVGTQTSGGYGGEADSDTQSASLRFRIGAKTQFLADLDLRRVRSDFGFVTSPLGPIPTRRRGPQYSSPSGSGGGAPGAPSGPSSGPGPGSPDSSAGSGSSSASIPSSQTDQPAGDDWTSGLGDMRLSLSRQVLGGGAKRFRLDAEVGLKLPTADEDKNLGTGKADYRLGVAGNYRFWTITGFGGVGWNSLGDPEWSELADVLDAYIGIQTEPLRDQIVLSGWLEGSEEVVAGLGSRSALGIGIRSTGRLRWRAQVTAGLGGSAEDFSALAGFSVGVPTLAIGSDRLN